MYALSVGEKEPATLAAVTDTGKFTLLMVSDIEKRLYRSWFMKKREKLSAVEKKIKRRKKFEKFC